MIATFDHALLILVIGEVAANHGGRSDDAEEGGRSGRAAHALGAFGAGDRHAARRPGAKLGEGALLTPPVEVAPVRRGAIRQRWQFAPPDLQEPVRVWERERREDHRVDDGEEGCRGANAKGQGQDRGQREPGFANERAKAVTEIVEQVQHGGLDVDPGAER